MKCPLCEKGMALLSEDISYGEKKEYNRKKYNCLQDDCWIVVEIPKK